MDQKFFAKVDKKYRRAIFNLILNAPVKAEKAYGREFAPFDFYPTILASWAFRSRATGLVWAQTSSPARDFGRAGWPG